MTQQDDRASILVFDADGVMRFRAWYGLSESYRASSRWSLDLVAGHAEARSDDVSGTTFTVSLPRPVNWVFLPDFDEGRLWRACS